MIKDITKRGVIDITSGDTLEPNQHNIDLTYSFKEQYHIGLFYSETPQSKTFLPEPYVNEKDSLILDTYQLSEQKAWFQEGIYTTKSFANIYEFATFVQEEMTCNHYITSGTFVDYKPGVKTIVVKGSDVLDKTAVVQDDTAVIARKQTFIKGNNKPGFMCIDIDTFKGKHLTLDETLSMLFNALPELKTAPIVIFPSTGSNISGRKGQNWVDKEGNPYPKDDIGNAIIRENHGFHIFVGIKNTWSMSKVVERIKQKMWLNDCGFIQISTDGKLLERCLVDTSVLKPVQPIYTYANITDKRLVQNIGEPWIINPNAEPFKLADIKALDSDEMVRYTSLVEEEKELFSDEADAQRKKWAIEQASRSRLAKDAQLEDPGSNAYKLVIKHLAEDYIKTAKERVLSGKQELYLTPVKKPNSSQLLTQDVITDPHGTDFIIRTVEQILESPDMYHGARCACIEDLYYAPGGKKRDTIDYTRGRIYIKHEPFPRVHDFAHGGTDYRLLRDKIEIDLTANNFDGVVDDALVELKKRNSIYSKGELPFKLLMNTKNRLYLQQINKHNFKYVLAQNFSFFDFENGVREETWPKDSFLVPILQEFCIRKNSETKGVTTIPYMDIKGHLRIKKGYDSSTGFIYDEEYNGFRDLEKRTITIKEMKRALEIVEEPIKLFRFSNNISSANMLASMITVVLKQWFNQDSTEMYPGFTADAPGNGIGKTKLLQILGVLLKGELPYIATLEGQAEEIKKEIGAKFASGEDFFLFDNVDRKVESSTMASIMTTKKVSFRILGLSKENYFDNSSFVTASGKNMRLSAELLRRFLNIRIEPVEVNYLTHDFGFDPVQMALDNRMMILHSLMVLYIGYKQNIKKLDEEGNLIYGNWEEDIKTLGSFEVWSRSIGGCVKFIGEHISDKIIIEGSGEGNLSFTKEVVKYGFPGEDIDAVFKEEVEKDNGPFLYFMDVFCKAFEEKLKTKGKAIFKFNLIKDDIIKSTEETNESNSASLKKKTKYHYNTLDGIIEWVVEHKITGGKIFVNRVKDYDGNPVNHICEDGTNLAVRLDIKRNKNGNSYIFNVDKP